MPLHGDCPEVEREMGGGIVYVVPDPRFFLSHRIPLALEAVRRGWNVSVATEPGPGVEQIRAAGIDWHGVRFEALKIRPWRAFIAIWELTRIYKRVRPRIVHHVTAKAVVFGTLAARFARVPVVVNAMTGLGEVFAGRSLSDRFWRAVTIGSLRVGLRHPCSTVVFQNDDDRDLLVSEGVVRRRDTVVIRGSGIDLDRFQPRGKEPDESPPIVAFISRLIRTKGVEDFVRAAAIVSRDGVPARFLCAGGRDRDSSHSISREDLEGWRGEGYVEFLGPVEDPRSVLDRAAVVCLPSRGGEGVPKTLLEAAACGLPIVTTDVPGCRDVVRDGWNGFLVPPRDPRALAEAVERLLGDRSLRKTFGERGRAIAEESFGVERVVAETFVLYEELNLRESARRSAE